MPQAPNLDGLPLWLRVVVSLIFVAVTAGVALQGYRQRLDREPPGASSTLVAAFPDLTAIRQLTDQSRILGEHVERLDSTMREHIHYLRNKIDVDAELSQRLRELREEMARSGR